MVQNHIDALIQDFTRDVSALVRESALGAARKALSSSPSATTGATSTPGRPTTERGALHVPGNALEGRLLAQLRAAPNSRTEQIGLALGVSTERIKPLLARLLASGAVTKIGQRRGTRYSIAR